MPRRQKQPTLPGLPPENVVAPSDLINMAVVIPLVQEGAEERMLGQIMSARTPAQLNRPWTTTKLETLIDTVLRVIQVRRAPSDIEGSLGLFLVVDAALADSGEVVTFSTSSLLVTAALVRAFLLRQLPLDCIPRRAAKPGGKGFHALHLEVLETVAV